MSDLNPPNDARTRLHDATALQQGVDRLTDEAAAILKTARRPAVVGIRRRGWILAQRIASQLAENHELHPEIGSLDITLYRDDLSQLGAQPTVGTTDLSFEIDGATILLVDDVLYTGRTIRAALQALVDFGRPAAIRLAVLVDRGLREYPIQADLTAFDIPTERHQQVEVMLREIDGDEAIDLLTRGEEAP